MAQHTAGEIHAVDGAARRREALLKLQSRHHGSSPTSSSMPSISSVSPERSQILVPQSSSPTRSPQNMSHVFNRQQDLIPRPPPSSSILMSSRIQARPPPPAAPANLHGTPDSVIRAIQHRKTAENEPRAHNHNSLSFEPSKSLASTSSTLLDSPETPDPHSRLKNRYADSPLKSPMSTPNLIRKPSLITAARQQQTSAETTMLNRLSAHFHSTPSQLILDAIRRHPGNADGAMEELSQMQRSGQSPASSSDYVPTPKAKMARPRPVVPPSPLDIPPTPVPVRQMPKPKKNEKSAIYANRTGGTGSGRRRDPDSESEAEEPAAGKVESDDSEMDWSGDEGRKKKRRKANDDELDAEGAAVKAFNEDTVELLTGTIACTVEQATKIIALRPYASEDDLRTKLNKARGVSAKLFEQYAEIMEGYVQIDSCLNKCESIAKDVADTLAVWRGASMINESVVGTPRSDGLNDVKVDVAKVSELLRNETDMRKRKVLSNYIQVQPASMSEGTVLKDYQLLGVNWLNLLYTKRIGCILADEMGLGKTIQVIAFLAHLKEKGVKGPHLIFVPASTLENWIREFDKFAPSIDVQTYYGSQSERAVLRADMKKRFRSNRLRVVLTSYTQVASADDLSFFRKKIDFETCIYDEGHKLKNFATKVYTDLLSIKPKWRLLLTGTPLQNNLQELVSLLMFIHKDTFTDAEPYLRALFKSQGHANLLSAPRTSRARRMLTPFVLRRRKAHVLTLPPKTETVETCIMTRPQATLYRETLQRSKKVLESLDDDALETAAGLDDADMNGTGNKPNGGKPKKEEKKVTGGASSSHILMDLRKAASHPLLFRRLYTDAKVRKIAKECLNTPKWCDSNFDYVVEDLEVMSDAEISHFCSESDYDEIRAFALEPKHFLEGGKVKAMQKHIERCKSEGKRMLLFSQFTMILDILQVALDNLGIRFTRLDGSTRTDERQAIVDEFTDDEDITVFLLSTKAGGVGINLVAASVVIIYDQDFNPHNDRQAADRAYRIGQEKEVEVIKLVSKDSIDEDMLSIGITKLQLDDAVGGEEVTLDGGEGAAGPGKDDKTAKEVRKSLLTTLRHKFEAGGEEGVKIGAIAEEHEHEVAEEKKENGDKVEKEVTKKKARAGASSQGV